MNTPVPNFLNRKKSVIFLGVVPRRVTFFVLAIWEKQGGTGGPILAVIYRDDFYPPETSCCMKGRTFKKSAKV